MTPAEGILRLTGIDFDHISRRDFLKISGGALGGLILALNAKNTLAASQTDNKFLAQPNMSSEGKDGLVGRLVARITRGQPAGVVDPKLGRVDQAEGVDPAPGTYPKSEASPTFQPTASPTATRPPEATATLQPTPTESGPKVKTVIFDRVIGSDTINLVNSQSPEDQKIGRFYELETLATIFVVPESIFVGVDNQIYCSCYVDNSTLITVQIGRIRTYVPGGRIELVSPSLYGKLPSYFGERTAGIDVRTSKPNSGWSKRTILEYLQRTDKVVTELSVQLTLNK